MGAMLIFFFQDKLKVDIFSSITKVLSFTDLINSGENVADEELNKHISMVTENEPCVSTLSSVSLFFDIWKNLYLYSFNYHSLLFLTFLCLVS